jgi:hypothetical protein
MVDESPFPGTSYYRIRQTDYDGKSKYSKMEEVLFTGDISYFNVKPNPTESTAEIIYECNEKTESAFLRVTDSFGKEVICKHVTCVQGENFEVISLSEYPDGIYFISLSSGKKVYKSKLVKMQK